MSRTIESKPIRILVLLSSTTLALGILVSCVVLPQEPFQTGYSVDCDTLATQPERVDCWRRWYQSQGEGQSTDQDDETEHGEASLPTNTFASVSVGWIHACGVRTDGSVVCWGYDGHGEASPPSGTFSSVSAGTHHTCGVRTDGSVDCWGYDGHGQSSPPSGNLASVSACLKNTSEDADE